MKRMFIAILFGTLVISVGCKPSTSDDPGAATPPSKAPVADQTGDTIKVSMKSTKLSQGDTETVSVEINRGTDFTEDVSLAFSDLPKGVTIEPAKALIKQKDTEAKLTLTAADDAEVGDFTVKVTGHPEKGADATAELKISIAKQEADPAADASAETQSSAESDNGLSTVGTWVSEDGGGRMEIAKVADGTLSGQMVWLAEPNYPAGDPEAGKPKRDRENPDADRRSAPVLGMTILQGFEYAGDGHWTSGTVYDPRSGKTYKCKLSTDDAGKTLKIHGYIGISLIGSTGIMTRYEDETETAKK